jgi:hypothetical protein
MTRAAAASVHVQLAQGVAAIEKDLTIDAVSHRATGFLENRPVGTWYMLVAVDEIG